MVRKGREGPTAALAPATGVPDWLPGKLLMDTVGPEGCVGRGECMGDEVGLSLNRAGRKGLLLAPPRPGMEPSKDP